MELQDFATDNYLILTFSELFRRSTKKNLKADQDAGLRVKGGKNYLSLLLCQLYLLGSRGFLLQYIIMHYITLYYITIYYNESIFHIIQYDGKGQNPEYPRKILKSIQMVHLNVVAEPVENSSIFE